VTFLAAFSAGGAPIDIKTMVPAEAASREIHSLGSNGEAQFACWSAGEESHGVCSSRIVRLDERVFLVGRPRLDRRRELAERLGANEAEPDALLCLRSYARWGERCLDYLRGDFCFVIWDETQRCLFCARDQLGVRPLFYEQSDFGWWISDSLKAIAERPDSQRELDDLWVGDFLTRAYSLEFDRTVYKKIRRLPPAHTLRVAPDGGQLKRYWALEPSEPILYRREGDYLERFHALLARAIDDRLPEGRVGVMMSGGIDSTGLAAKAVEITANSSRVAAFTFYHERAEDDGAYLSGLVARDLGISHTLVAVDDLQGMAGPQDVASAQEPGAASLSNPARQEMERQMQGVATVWFLGEGPDNALTFEWKSYLRWLWRKRERKSFVIAVSQYLIQKQVREWCATVRKVSFSRSNGAFSTQKSSDSDWLHPALAERLLARNRDCAGRKRNGEWWSPGAMESFTSAIWPAYFEVWDPATSGSRLDYRHPYLDLELLDFMLRTPPIPWGRRKALVRRAMRGRLPDEILDRDKTAAPDTSSIRSSSERRVSSLEIGDQLQRFIDPVKFAKADPKGDRFVKIEILDAWLKRNELGSGRPT
jgi:asparagine synthase (glutamine-hydrolysing)